MVWVATFSLGKSLCSYEEIKSYFLQSLVVVVSWSDKKSAWNGERKDIHVRLYFRVSGETSQAPTSSSSSRLAFYTKDLTFSLT